MNKCARLYDRHGKRVRGLWVRNNIYYAQIRVGGHKTRVRLEHADTVPQAVTELQALKRRRRAGKLSLPQKNSFRTIISKDRLLSPEELEQLGQAALLDPKGLMLLDPRVRHLRAAKAVTGQHFSDYMRFMAYSGGREQETLQLRWQNAHWKHGLLHFPGASQGGKRGGGGRSNQANHVMLSFSGNCTHT